jgi:isopenicillin-N epimerase
MCAPKSVAFLWVSKERQRVIRPLVISHGANSSRKDRSRFQLEFGWMGTTDPCAILTVPETIRYMGSLLPGGWPEIRRRNHELAVAGRRVICEALGIEVPCPDEMIGSLAAIPIPAARAGVKLKAPLMLDPLQNQLLAKYNIEAPVIPWPAWPERLLRVSAQLYNSLPQYEKLAEVMKKRLGR